MIIGNLIIYATGILWLSGFVGWEAVLSTGVLPFLIGDALKVALATILLPTGWRIVGHSGPESNPDPAPSPTELNRPLAR
jgi:biotin transport system substrate-specific component